MKRLLFFAMLFCCSLSAQAQEIWNLQRCVDYALQNNLTITQSKLSLENVKLSGSNLDQQRYPTLNAGSNFGINFGRTVNPATNDFETDNSLFNSWNLNTGVPIYNGGQITNSIKQNKIDLQSSSADLAQTQNDVALNVALTYLNLLFSYENVTNAQAQLALTQQQLAQLDKLIAAGSRPENERYDILAQIATDEQSIITTQNSVDNNLLALKQAMMLDAGTNIQIDKPDIDVDQLEALENYTLQAVYDAAVSTQPNVQASELRIQSAEMDVDIAKGQLKPTLNVGGSLGLNWSDLAKQGADFQTVRIPQNNIFIDNNPVNFATEQEIPGSLIPIPYFEQLNNNLAYGFSASLNIPIYNRGQAKTAVSRAKLNVQSAETNAALVRQGLRTNIQNALASTKAAKKTLEASRRALEASRIAFQNAQRRFDLGVLSTFEYISARVRMESAEINLLNAKYDYLFQNKVIAFYLGRKLTLEN